MEQYGKEIILDLHGCNPKKFNRCDIGLFFDRLCERLGVQQGDRHFWDDVGVPPEEQQQAPHLKGTSAVQFILTSNITIHTLDLLHAVYLNVFSCADFDGEAVKELAIEWFGGRIVGDITFPRT